MYPVSTNCGEHHGTISESATALSTPTERAAAIITLRNNCRGREGAYLVDSAQHPGRFYRVSNRCQCVDYARAPNGWCRHRLAIRLYAALERVANRVRSGPANAAMEVTMLGERGAAWSDDDHRSRANRIRLTSANERQQSRQLIITRLALLEAAAQFCAARPSFRSCAVVRLAVGSYG